MDLVHPRCVGLDEPPAFAPGSRSSARRSPGGSGITTPSYSNGCWTTPRPRKLTSLLSTDGSRTRRRLSTLTSSCSAEALLAEIGTDMTAFPTAGQLASWAGMCPGQPRPAPRAPTCPGATGRWCAAAVTPRPSSRSDTRSCSTCIGSCPPSSPTPIPAPPPSSTHRRPTTQTRRSPPRRTRRQGPLETTQLQAA